MKKNKYHAYLHDGRYIQKKDDDGSILLDWDETMGEDIHEVGNFDTFSEALDAVREADEKYAYNSYVVENDTDGEVASCTLEYSKCTCCGHETFNRDESITPWGNEYLEKGI